MNNEELKAKIVSAIIDCLQKENFPYNGRLVHKLADTLIKTGIMQKNVQMSKNSTLDTAYKRLKYIDNYKELQRNKLTLEEYRACLATMTDIMVYGKSTTFFKSSADFFKKCGFKVVDSEDGVGYVIYGGKEDED